MAQLMIVRRGQTDRFRSLQETFGREPIAATVVWDRRESDRRGNVQSVADDRRRRDRRGPLPSTWNALDFLVVKPSQPATNTSVSAGSQTLHPIDGDVLIRREVGPRGPCTISQVPDGAVGLYGTYEAALQQAEALAEQAGVDLWYTEDHRMFKALRTHRRSPQSA